MWILLFCGLDPAFASLLPGKVCAASRGHTTIVRFISSRATRWGDGTLYFRDLLWSDGLKKNFGRAGNWRSLKLAVFPWCQQRAKGGFTQAPKMQVGGFCGVGAQAL